MTSEALLGQKESGETCNTHTNTTWSMTRPWDEFKEFQNSSFLIFLSFPSFFHSCAAEVRQILFETRFSWLQRKNSSRSWKVLEITSFTVCYQFVILIWTTLSSSFLSNTVNPLSEIFAPFKLFTSWEQSSDNFFVYSLEFLLFFHN